MDDKGYNSDTLREQVVGADLESVIPFRKYRTTLPEIGHQLCWLFHPGSNKGLAENHLPPTEAVV